MIEVTKVTNTVNRLDFLSVNYMRRVGLNHLKNELRDLVKTFDDDEIHNCQFVRCSSMLDVLGTLQIIPLDAWNELHNMICSLYTYDISLRIVIEYIDRLVKEI